MKLGIARPGIKSVRSRRNRSAAAQKAIAYAAGRHLYAEQLEDRTMLAANLVLVGVVNPSPTVISGTNLTYSFTLSNAGDQTATNVHLTDLVPANTTFFSAAETSGPTFTPSVPTVGGAGTVDFAIAALAAGTTATFNVIVKVNPSVVDGIVITDTGNATSPDDPVTSDNSVTLTSTARAAADVTVTKTLTSALVTAGGDVTYSIVVSDAGPSDALNVVVTDVVPANTIFASVTQTGGPAFAITQPPIGQGGLFTGTIPVLHVGETSTFSITFHVPSNIVAGTPVNNTAFASSSTFDPNPINNSSTVDEVVVIDSDIQITLASDQTQPIYEGGRIDYYITVTNLGPSDAQGVRFNFNTPGGELFDFVNQLSGPGAALGFPILPARTGLVSGDIAAMAVGDSAKFVVELESPEEGLRTGVATCTSSTPDLNLTNNTATDLITILDAPLTTTSTPDLSALTNKQITNVTVLTFTDANPALYGGPYSLLSDYTATIDWGDGTTSNGLIHSVDAFANYYVVGTHTYTTPGSYQIHTVTLDEGGATASGDAFSTVVAGPPVPLPGVPITANEGQSGTYTVGSFSDPQGLGSASSYLVNINWGDNTPITAGILTPNAKNGYDVSGTHAYGEEGSYSIKFSVARAGNNGGTVNATTAVTVADVPVVGTGVNFTAAANKTNGPYLVATFTDPGGAEVATDYSASIDWGDGIVSPGIISASGTTFSVTGNHTYTALGTPTVTTTVKHDSATNALIFSKATVLISTSAVAVTPKNFAGVEGTALSNTPLATFTYTKTAATAASFKATVNWGDGTATQNATVVSNGGGKYTVTGTHTYLLFGVYKGIITVVGPGGVTDTGIDTITITDAPLVAYGTTINAKRSTDFAGVVGSFVDTNLTNTNAAVYIVSIDWGDGSKPSAGTVVFNAKTKRWDVSGTHIYLLKSPALGFKITLNVKDSPLSFVTYVFSKGIVT